VDYYPQSYLYNLKLKEDLQNEYHLVIRRGFVMKLQFVIIMFCSILGFSSFAGEREGGGGHQVVRSRTATARPGNTQRTFPSYPSRSGSNGVRQSVPNHSDALGNRVTQDHNSRIQFANGRSESVMRNNVRVTESVHIGRSAFVNSYRPGFESRSVIFNRYSAHYNELVIGHPLVFNYWHRHYFYGGFYYGFHPLLNIDAYFYNPMVYWMFVPTYNEYYYRTWYSAEYDAYPALHYPFLYHGLYYPTENLKQLLFGVSAMPVDRQVQFRAALTNFTKELAQTLANETHQHVRMTNGDVVVTHYAIVGYDESIELEGFVNLAGVDYNFKGLLDLQEPAHTSVFVPQALDQEPTDVEAQPLDQMNAKIDSIKGESQGAPIEAEIPATPAEVTAEPQTK
jgi:hypothetical protein